MNINLVRFRLPLPFVPKRREKLFVYFVVLLGLVSFFVVAHLHLGNSKLVKGKNVIQYEAERAVKLLGEMISGGIKNAAYSLTRKTWDGSSNNKSEKILPIRGQAWPLKEEANRTDGTKNIKYRYTILLWKHGPRMVRRFLRSYSSEVRDPYTFCSVNNCAVTIDDEKGLEESDAVLIHLHRTSGPASLPPYRSPNQRWIFFTDESPVHTFFVTSRYKMHDYNGLFNWSMTYRSDSDISVPYGRTIVTAENRSTSRGKPLPNFARTKKKLVAILGSNCGRGGNYRWEYVKELAKHIKVDIYGRCGELKCPGHFTKDCPLLNQYKFYLAFENSNCREYITEKLWWNAYSKDIVPVVRGAPKEDYERLCPPGSFIHVDDFPSPKYLANYLLALAYNDTAYNEYFEWKKNFVVLNEHGYFGSPSLHLCRICEALNRDTSGTKIYTDLEKFWHSKRDCYAPLWTPKKS